MSAELALSTEEAQALLERVCAHLVRFQWELERGAHPASYLHDSLDVGAYAQGRAASEALREDTPPEEGADMEALLAQLFGPAMASGTLHPHAGFMAHVPSGGLLQGAVGELIARALNRFAGVWAAAPGFVQLESNVIRWFCSMLGYGEGSFGYLTTGGSLANLMGLRCALARVERAGLERCTVYVSEQAHFSALKAAGILGIPRERVRVVACRPDLALDVTALEGQLLHDRTQGLVPACVVATAGTTNTGAIDDLGRVRALSAALGVWMHVDACFGGFFRLTARGAAALAGIEEADSIAVDAHKSLFLPHGLAALLVRERAHLKDTFAGPGAAYLPGSMEEQGMVDFCNYGPELSREVRGLAAWLPLKMHGVDAFRRCLDEKLDLALLLAERLAHVESLRVLHPHALGLPVVCFKLRTAAGADAEELLNRRLCERICARGRVYVTTTQLPGHGLVVRACILHHRTGAGDVERLLEDVQASVQELVGRGLESVG